MERLTVKTGIGYLNKLGGTGKTYTKYDLLNDFDRCIQKLGKLEDIEEEIGIPLEVLFKALLNGILDEDGRYHSKVRLSNKLGYIGLVDEEGYCWDTKKYLDKWWIFGRE